MAVINQDVERIYELSPMQEAMLVASLVAPDSGVYLVQVALRLSSRLDVEAFERAWRSVVERHEILRTGFYWEDQEKPVQVVYREVDLPLRRESWRGLEAGEQEERLQAFLDADREQGFDLGAPPLLRLALIELDGGEWQIVWSMHHILTDGWSRSLLLRELFESYAAFAAGREPELAAPRPFEDYIVWLQRLDPGAAEAFWRESLAGFSSPTLVAGTNGHGPLAEGAASFRASRLRSERLPAAETAALRELARRHRLTLATVVYGAWALVVAQETGAGEVVFGGTVTGRPLELAGIESMIGLFINTLPVRVAVDPARGLLPWLADLQEWQSRARQHESAPLADIHSWSSLQAGVPLFDNILVIENFPVDGSLAERLPDLGVSSVRTSELTGYPLHVVVFPGSDLQLDFIYDARRVDDAAVARMKERLTSALRAFAAAPEARLGEVPLLLPGERHQVVVEHNDTAASFPSDLCLHKLVAAQAARTPQAVAVRGAGKALCYGELAALSGRLARRLVRLGVGPEVLVGVCAERTPSLLVALLGVLEAGGAYVPLDPTHPRERLGWILADSQARVVLTERSLLDVLPPHGAQVVLLDEEGEEGNEVLPRVAAESLAYVIYTSGSTGRPKGVELCHRGVVNYLTSMASKPGLGAGDVLLAVTTLSFDIAVTELFLPLSVGARVELVDRDTAGDATLLADALESSGATCMQATPATWSLLVEGGWPGRSGLKALCGGEALPRALAEKLLPRVGELWNMYGPTETTVWSALLPVSSGEGPVPVGLPLANTSLHLLSRQGDVAPLGAVGELAIGGEGLARGYHRRPELTAERFVPDPFGGLSGAGGTRLYRTGDLARRQPEGTLEFLGRSDHQVKLRGFRIELGEIEAVLASHPAVRGCVVVARQDGERDKMLVAYVVFRTRPEEAGALRAFLAAKLPPYMVPAVFVPLSSLPLSPAGKVDRNALPAPEIGEEGGGEERFGPSPADPTAELVAGIWAEVLGRERVGIDDDFFALGGHSLLATRVVSRLRNVLGVELPLRSVLEQRTVGALAAAVRIELQGDRFAAPLRPVPRQDDLPLSFAQERFWFIDQLEPGSPRYNIAAAVRLTGPLAVLRLERAFFEVARRHEVLRTTFGSHNGRPVQIIAPSPRLPLPVVDLSGLGRDSREAAARQLAAAESLLPFDLETGPLLRLTLVRLAGEDHLLLATLHHIVADAWSLVLLVREVQALYRAWSHGAASPLPELPIQYADFAAWQRQWLDGEGLERQLAYWRERLDGSTGVLELPVDRPRPALLSLRGGEHRFAIDRELARRIQAVGRRAGATPFMVTTAALCTLLSRLSGEPDLTLATPIAARQRLELESLIGCFVNTLVLRVDGRRAETFLDLLDQVREAGLGAYAHQDLPFERLVNELQPERDLSRSPLAQVALAFHNIGLPEADLDGLRMVSQDPPSQVAKFDLAFVFAENREGGFSGWLQYSSDLYDPTTAIRLTEHLTRCLDELTAWPEQPLADLSYLTEGERQQTLLEWNDTASPAPEVLLHQLFEAQAEARPAALAVAWQGIEQTYGELEARANRVARLLARRVEPGTGVGVWMERSHHTVAAVLGILKAGGTYVPLDPAWPAERVETILAATGATALVASRSTLSAAEALRWRLPRLRDLVCLDVEEQEVEPEAADEAGVRALWDLVAARATDRVTAGGFTSSFTGQPLSEAEVDEYRDRVLALAEPWLRPGARVLEVGCGAGLLLWEMARRVESCVGLDPSPITQRRNREHADAAGIGNVELAEGFAHELGGRFAAGSFDLVVMASTVQFFPGPRYLEKVVTEAMELLAPGGALLLADVPDARREADFRDALAAMGVPAKRGERELWLDEELFRDLPGAGSVEILHRTKGFSNELRYRYDVLLQAETGAPRQRSKRLWTGWHVEQHPATRPSGVRSPDEIAYVIHTSGSTGVPKGIAVQHRPVAGLIRWVNETFGVGPDDRLLFITPLTFDLSVYDIFGTLAAGGTVQVAPESALGNAEHLVRLLCETPVTIWDSAPAALQQLAPLFPPVEVGAASALRLVLLSGDWIPVRLPDQVRAAFPGTHVVSLGGATEAAVWSNWYPIGVVDPQWPSIPYGRPITGARYHVLDAGMLPCPIGVPGDLYIGGSCLCTGYAGQPELTASTFVPDPFAPPADRGARLYRTGDRARAWRDGNLEFLGRADQRVKVRGYRIEPGEIEVALLRHPALREAVVTVREDRPGDQMLVAYVVPREEAPPAEELRTWLRGKLPSYMVPAAFVTLAALPVTANGKLDRSRLPDPRLEQAEESYTAPADAVEELLADLFADLLDLERVGTGDSFFALGGHSLLATQLLSRVRERLGVELLLAQLFEGPTVADLAREVRSARQAGAAAAPPILPVPRPASGELPLSFAQQRLWFVDQLEPGNPAYNIPWAARLCGALDAALLRRILNEVVRRHEALRSTFARSPRGPVARVQERRVVPLPVVSLEGLPGSAATAEVRRLVAAEALGAFDLARGPLLRATLLRLEPREHVLVAVMHHIVSDGWSMGVLLREVGDLYRAFSAGAPSPLPELPIQYTDFAVWQREWLQGDVLADQLAYWRDELAGAPQSLELPADRPRPSWPAHRAGVLTTLLAPDLSRELAAFSRREGVTLFMSLLAAFGVLLGRLANQEDVLVGSPVANRNRREIEELIGFFVNTLVLRVPLRSTPQPGFRELLVRVRQAALGAYTHQDLPFERLVEELVTERADRSGGPPPLFQVMLGVQNAPVAPLELPGLEVSPLALEGGVAKFDLTLQFAETLAGLNGWLEYDAELFDRTTAERLLARLEGLLRNALAEPDRGVGELGLLLAGERAQLIWEWNNSASVYPREAALGELFAEHARVQPQAPAVVEAGETWSYGRLEEESNRLAWHLRSLGVESEVRVGVAMERSAALVLAVLAVVKAGGTYVPLDAGYPDDRLRFMLEDAGVTVVLVHGRTRQRLVDLAAGAEPWRLVCVECDRDEIATCPATALPGAGAGEQLAYVTYTSGSTGRPKGVAVPQGAVVRLVKGADYVQLGPADRVAHASNVSFDAATFEIWGALANGGAVVVIDREVALSPGRLAEHLRQERVTAMFLTTALFNQVVRDEPTAFYPLAHLMVGGEALDPALMGRALSEGPPERLLQVYGPTESTTFAVWGEIREIPSGALSVPLGRPLANTTAYVADAAGELAVPGQTGELWLGGGGLARGYFNRPDLTAERFVPDGWSGEPGERLYRTGDLVRWRPDGTLDFLGRIDAQVKIRGFRIEPGEVEAVLASSPGVRECAVLARRAPSGDPAGQPGELRLVAYVVAAPGSGLREAAVRDFLKQSLPDYMVPAVFLFLDALPLTPNGKVDRAALPAPEGAVAAAVREDGSVAPRDPVEGLLAGIWEEVLGRERVGVTDDFFALGGHSLLATQVVSRVRETFGVEVPVHDLFERPTIAQLGAELQLLLQGQARLGEVPPILPVPRSPGDDLPLSFAQQRLWFVEQLEPDTPFSNMPWSMRLTGALDSVRLRRTLEEVVRRHEALRTTFHGTSRGPVARVLESQPVPLPVISLEGLPESAAEAEVQRLGLAELLRPFDLERGPLLRAILLRLGAREHVLVPVMHHIVSDGWSMGVLQREVALLYGAFSHGDVSPLPDLPIQYADFTIWQREWMQGEVLEVQLAHWRGALAGAPLRLELPTDRPRPVAPTHRGGALPTRLPGSLTRELEAFSRREGVTPFMTLLAVFGVLMGRLANQDDVLVGSPIANRNRREIEDLIGFFVNTLVLRVVMRGTPPPSFRELLGRVREAALGAYTHQDLPFERLVEELVTERGGGHPPLVQTMFVLQNAPAGALELPSLTLSPYVIENGLARFDLTLVLEDSPSGFPGYVEYDAELFDRTTAERLLDRFAGLLESALAEPDRGVEELGLLLPGERAQLLWEWNDTARAYPREAGLPELFAQVARELPEEPAILASGEVWTYRQLDEESSRLARRLSSLGVGAETPVGIAMERSPELILGMLAILKAGGIYVPLDARYPDERLAFMLEDTGARVVLVHEATRERIEALRPRPHLELVAWGLSSSGEEGSEGGCAAGGDALAYVIYTSGSTGRPKGVAVTHQAIVRLVRETNYVHLGPGARLGHVANISFDAATYEIWGALLTGAAVVVIPRETVLDLPSFATALREQQVTSMFLTSALFARMAQEVPDAFQHMSELLVGGEAVDPAAARRVLAHRPPRRLLDVYGPTESTTFATWHLIREVSVGGSSIPIGLPLANTTAWVLDRWQELLPPGAAGELYLGGDGLARGYLNRPELTAERFVPHPWVSGGRLYRTGDLVRQLADGAIEYLGRLDDQVKIRGFRIEPGEIEAVLAGHPGVRECAVLARRDGATGEIQLVAYAVIDPQAADGDPELSLRAWLKERLPEYLIPAAWVFLDALPLTANGKLDRRALPDPRADSADDRKHVAPSGPIEERLAVIWAEVLRLDRIGAHDDFFALGGHSLLATQVVTRVREAMGLEMPLRLLFEAPSLRQLAGSLGEMQTEQSSAPVLSRASAPVEGGEPLSFAQQRLWLLDQLVPGNPAYNVPLAVRLRGEVSVEALERTFAEVVRRHAVLRTTFAVRDDRPEQVIAPPEAVRLELQVLDLSEAPGEAREEWARELALEEARAPFDLGRGPLLRIGLLRLAGRDHLLLVTLHHIVSDGWSMGVLLREIEALYPAFLRSEPSPLPELPLQYADFARWQRSWLQGDVLERQLVYWKETLAGAPTLLELPTDRPRPAVQRFQGATRAIALSTSLSERVRELGRREGATPFMILLATWAALLGRHAGQEDLLLGTPIAGRNRREIEDLIGFFVNTLVLRVRTASPSFQELLGQVRETALEAFAHQELPFERLVEELVPERDLAYSPLVQAVFALQNTPARALSVPGLFLEPVNMDNGTEKFDLTLALQEGEGVFSGALGYSMDLFDGSTALRLLARFEVLLEAATRAPEHALSALTLLSPAEGHQILREWNDLEKPCPQVPMVHELFSLHARRQPEAVAVDGVEGRLTYGELEARSNRLAHHLRRLGVGPEVLVALCTERTPERVVGIVAVLKAGGAYVSLDPSYPRERLAFLLEDAGATVLLTQSRFLAGLPESGAQVICLDADQAGIEGEEDRAPLTGVGPDNLAYVIYTSGSTGRPKGVEIPHAGLMNLVRWHQDLYQVRPEDRATQIASPAFDASIWELWPYLAAGASVHIPDEETRLSAPGMIRWWSEQGITLAYLMTPLAEGVLEEKIPQGLDLNVRALIIGGDRLHRRPDPTVDFRLMNHYGPAEYTVTSTVVEVSPPVEGAGLPTIGRPLDNTQVYLLDRHLEPVPIGVPAELFVAGTGIARGYLRRPELTAGKFLPNPFSAEPGARMYRTGDLVRALPDGDMDFLGRLDHQVKIRGMRIELGEIESVLGRHPGVREAVVLAREDRPGQKRLVAYLVLAEEAPPVEELRRSLKERLPEYMVPAVFMVLESLPLTPNGKVDRRALPVPEPPRDGRDGSDAPSDSVEELLARIWIEVLQIERVGMRDNFFALGGHSLLATQVRSRLREVFGVDLPLRMLFETPTLGELAEAVRRTRQTTAQAPPITPAPRDPRGGELPLSFAQQRLWLIDQLEPGSPAYNVPLAVRLSGELSVGLLRSIFTEIVRRHEALRTTFVDRAGRPFQVIAPELVPELPVVDLSCLPDEAREARARILAREEMLRPFSLETGPLLRLTLVRMAGGDHLLLLTLHHIISDGWSMSVLLREIGVLYEAFAEARPSPLPDLSVQYADFAVWQRNWLQGPVLQGQLDHWKRGLAGAPRVLELPTDRPRPAIPSYRGATRLFVVPHALFAEVRRICAQKRVTPFMALLAAWATLLGRHAGQEDVLVGSPIANRNRQEIEDLIGFFVNTLVLRADLSGGPTFTGLLDRIRTVALEAFSHQDLPFERLVEEMVPERDLAHSPLVQALFVLQNVPAEALVIPGLTLTPLTLESATSKLDLLLTLAETGEGGLTGGLEYSTDLFDADRIARLQQQFAVLLAGAVAEPERPLATLPLLTGEERTRVLSEWNDNAAVFPRTAVHIPVEEQAERTPEALAVLWAEDGTGWTYRELDRQANQLAHHLRALGVGPDERVAICLERSLAPLVAVLGVLKAGGAYVPIDPDYPADRVAFLLADSESRVLITTSGIAGRLPLDPEQRVVLLDAHGQDIAARSTKNPMLWTTPDHLAYVIYTSGSTGRPKGVAMPHGVLANMLAWQSRASAAGPGSRTLQFASLSFDVSFQEIFSTWWTGGTVVALPQETRRDSWALCRVLDEQRIERLFLPFVALQQIAETIEQGAPMPTSLSEIITAGEQLQVTRPIAAWLGRSGARLENHYGPSEGHVVTAHRLAGRPAEWPVLPPIGRPIPNVRMYLLDRHFEPVPQGVPGHLCFGGTPVVRGYLDRPELTAERFVPDPFGGEPGARLYATGDRAQSLADGTFRFLGRIDQQVKIRGFRVEPGEVESALTRHPAVRAAAVVVHGDGVDRRLVGYYVADMPLESGELRAALAGELPDYMVPALLVRLEALPLTPSGKLDRRSLPDPQSAEAADASHAAPADPVEELLAGIWAEILRRDHVGIHDDFFALGGHSLLATQVMSRVRTTFGMELPLRQLFETSTVAGFARAVRTAGRGGEPEVPPILPAVRPGAPLLSFAQQRLWLIDQLEPGNPAYNIPLAVRLTGELSVEALERTFAEVVRRHEVLRTTFAVQAGQPVQVIASPAAVRLELRMLDLSDAPEEAREEWALELALDEARSPFDLARGPLLRLGLLRLDEREHLLLVTFHHIVSDAWSLSVLLREIEALYPAFLHGEPPPLPELPLQYADFAHWQRSWLQGEVLERQLTYWKGRLAGAPQVLELPTDRPRPAAPTYGGAVVDLTLPSALSAAVHDLCRKEQVTPFMLLLAVWATLLGRHAEQDDVLVGIPIAGRNRQEIEDLIGFFVNTLVLRVELPGNPTFVHLLRRVRETALDAFAHQDFPFELLVDELAVERSLAHTPLFQVTLNLQNAPAGTLRIPGLTISPFDRPISSAKFDLALAFGETAEGLAASLQYATDLFDRATAERFLRHLANLLASAAEDPARPVSDLRLMDAAEERLLRIDLNRAGRTWALPAAVQDLWTRQAGRIPDKTAAVGPQGALTYREIEERSNALARLIQGAPGGARLDRRIGLLADPDPQVLTGMIGILKAGGGFVPIDPRQPDERAAWILEDSACEVLVTDRRHLERGMKLAQDAAGRYRVLCLDDVGAEGAAEAGELRDPGALRSLAYVVYTSGSTGTPKGVQVAQESLVPMLLWGCEIFGLGERSRVLQSLSFYFDFGIFEHLTTLIAGGTLHFPGEKPGEAAGDPAALAREIARHGIDILHTTPAFARELAATRESLDSLEVIHLGGEALPWDTVERLREVAPRAILYNGYGPTEATINSSIFRIDGRRSGGPVVPIGDRSADNALYIVDRAGCLAPHGARGELLVGGIGVARGYLNRPELTAERFVPDPFGSVPGGRLYRTGDLVRYLSEDGRPGGEIEFLGRVDHQVKLRGFRIELGEIEAVLRSHPAVSGCVALVRTDAPGDPRLVAYVVLDRADPEPALRSWLQDRLPGYMLPAAYVTLEALPLTATGKVDRRALPAPSASEIVRGAGEGYVAPSDPVEEKLAAVWTEVLRLERVGVRDDFFALGGHSMLATQVMSRLREVLGVDLPLRALFEKPTIGALAEAVRARQEGAAPAPSIVPAGESGPLHLSEQLATGAPAESKNELCGFN